MKAKILASWLLVTLAIVTVPLLVTRGGAQTMSAKHIILRLYPYVPTPFKEVRKCPVCAEELPAATVDESKGSQALDSLLAAKTAAMSSCRFVVAEKEQHKPFALDIKEDRDKVKSLASDMNADEILYPVLLRYRQRVGSDFAASQPASVNFHLHLLETSSMKEIWKAIYSEEQQPLSQNLLKSPLVFKRKFRWVTAERLTEDGLVKVLKNFPDCEGGAK